MENWKNRKYIFITTFLSALILIIYAAQLSVPVISDETVTMANAAWVTGRDWSLMIAHLGGLYYRFIQALMTVPLFAWLDDPDMIYRGSMILQAVVQASTVPVVYLLCRRHLRMESSKLAAALGAAVCFVPSIALYVFYYRGDYLLSVLPWYALLFFLETIKAADAEKKAGRAGYTVAAVVCCALGYMAHTRGIVLMIALIMSALFIRIFMKQKSLNWPICVCVFVLMGIVDNKIGGILKQALYSISGLNANAFESTDMGSYLNVFSWQTLKGIILLCLSWLNTLVVTTQGLVLIGMVVLLVVTATICREAVLKWRIRTAVGSGQTSGDTAPGISIQEKVTMLFCFLVFVGYFAVGALFFKGVYYPLLTGENTRRVDRLLYDRYAICGAGMMVFLALYVLCCRREWLSRKMKLFCMVLAVGLFAVFLWKFLPIAVKYTGYI
ncbi:MAG: hypothetical protein LIO94_05780, partial [Clostridiales bacterium]|nr:hypothetical protein [Clostridiales bacterium]